MLPIELTDSTEHLNVTYAAESHEFAIDTEHVKVAGWVLDTKAEQRINTTAVGEKDDYKLTTYEFNASVSRPRLSAVGKTLIPIVFQLFVVITTLAVRKAMIQRIQVQATALLGVVMFHVSATAALPALGYMTRLDKFMVAADLVAVVSVVLSAAMLYLEEHKNEAGAHKVYRWSAIVVPVLTVATWTLIGLRVL